MDGSDIAAIILGIILFAFIIVFIAVFTTVSINCKKCFIPPLPPFIDPCLHKFYQQIQSKLVGNDIIGQYNFLGAYTSIGISDDGDTIVVGGFADNGYIGCAYVFVKQNGIYHQFGPKLVGTGYIGEPEQGIAVAISGDGSTVAIGGWTDNSEIGATWIFIRSLFGFVQQGPKLSGLNYINVSYQGDAVRKIFHFSKINFIR
jgi:hypothetical protein